MAASALAEQERLRWIVDELDVLAPQPREWEEVSVEHKRLSHAAGLLEGARAAIDTLSDADTSALVAGCCRACAPDAARTLRRAHRADRRAARRRADSTRRSGLGVDTLPGQDRSRRFAPRRRRCAAVGAACRRTQVQGGAGGVDRDLAKRERTSCRRCLPRAISSALRAREALSARRVRQGSAGIVEKARKGCQADERRSHARDAGSEHGGRSLRRTAKRGRADCALESTRSSSWSQATPASARSRSLVLHPAASSRASAWRSR